MMQVPVQITIRNMGHSEAIEEKIREKANKLNRFYDHIIACQVVIEQTTRHKHQGKLYNVRINLDLPGKGLVANHKEKEDLYISLREAFDDMVRQLEKHINIRQGDVKAHPELLRGEVARIFKEEDFGFIVTPNGDEFYFNASNVVHPHFNKLEVGTPVQFIEAMGDEGPQAHRVSAHE
jgi:ribosomal subunit interface protein